MMKQSFIQAYKRHHDLEAEVQFFEERQKDKAEERAKQINIRRTDQELADREDEDKIPESRSITESHFDE